MLMISYLANFIQFLKSKIVDNERVSQRWGCSAQQSGTPGLINKMNN